MIGIGIALLISGVVLTETVFNIPGIGRLTVDAITTTGAANVFRNLERKADQAGRMFDSLTRHMRDAQAVPRAETYEQEAQVPVWAAS